MTFGLEIGLVVAGFLLVLLIIGYIKAPPDTAIIISGLRKKPRVLVGRAGWRVPFLERIDKLSLNIISIDIRTAESVPTSEFINVKVDGVANVKIDSSPEHLKRAAESLLGKKAEHIRVIAQQVLEGNMREIIGQMRLSELVHDRATFAIKVQENAAPDMAAMGLQIVNLNIQNFSDDNDTIKNLGMDNVVQIQKTAAIAKAQGERDIKIAQAKAKEEANNASVAAEEKIAVQDNLLQIRKAELKREADIKLAEADAAYKITEQEQRRTIEIKSKEADIASVEQQAILSERSIAVRERELDAEVRKLADAAKYKAEQEASALLVQRQKEAEAKRYEAEQEAIAKRAMAEAVKYAKMQEAEGIRAIGLAEAEAIEKKAQAQKKMGEASVLEMYLAVLPEIVKNAASPLAQTEKIVMYGEGNSAKFAGDVMGISSQITEALKQTLGIDIPGMISNASRSEKLEEIPADEEVTGE